MVISRRAPGHMFRLALAALLLIIAVPDGAAAIEAPPAALQTYLQTNGPTNNISNGDWYTNNANGAIAGYHYHEITVPCGWPAADPVYIDLFSPEMVLAAVGDEVRPTETLANANDTTFELYGVETLIGPNPDQPAAGAAGSILATTYTPLAAGESWRRFATLAAPVACGTYVLRAATVGDDENSWRVRVGTDDDADPNNAPPANYDNPDGLPGTDDEVFIGVRTGSYQNDVTAAGIGQCLTLYEFVAPGQLSVEFNNFDMDGTGRVRYYAPSDAFDPLGQTGGVAGSPSGGSVWNGPGGTTTNRGAGDAVANPEPGWWRIVTCISKNNQYIQEGQTNASAYYDQPPVPAMTVAKDDAVSLISPNDLLTYTISYANTSSGSAAGTATSVVLQDTIPTNAAYVSCSIPVADGTCSEAAGVVTFTLSRNILPGAGGSVQVTVQVSPTAAGGDTVVNTATLDYKDSLGNPYPRQSATDSDTVQVTPALPVMAVSKDDGVTAAAPGDSLTYAIRYENVTASAPAKPATNVVLRDTLPSNASYVGCVIVLPATGTCGEAGGVVTFTIFGSLVAGDSGLVRVTITVNAGAGGTLQNTVTLDYKDDVGNPRPQQSATDTDQLPAPDLRLVKSADSARVTAGQLVTYTLAYFNDSPATATGVKIAETVPTGTRFVAAGGTPGWSCADGAAAGTPCTLLLGAVAGNTSGAATFIVRIDTPLPAGITQIDNTAIISDDGTHGPDPTPGNNSGTTLAPPLPITLLSLTARAAPGGTLIRWQTGAEIATLGFHIYRSADGDRAGATRVTPALLVARGQGGAGASYGWLDIGAPTGAPAAYWLQVVDSDGTTREEGPAFSAAHGLDATTLVFLPIIVR